LPLNIVELLGDFSGLALDGVSVSRISESAGMTSSRPLIGSWCARATEREEFLPLAGAPGSTSSNIKAAAVSRMMAWLVKPPVHVERAASALKLILQARRKTDVAVANGFCFSAAGSPPARTRQ